MICIAGLPGSGKTWLGSRLAQELGGMLLDDLCDLAQLPDIGSVDHLIITDPNFCATHVRDSATKILIERYGNVRWIFFMNDPQKCRVLVDYRCDGRKVDQLIEQLSKVYQIPHNAVVRPIWQPD